MKKLLTALILSALLLSGCGAFRSHHAWKKAKQENPLQIPPGMDRPATSDALSIPPPGNDTASAEEQQSSAAAAAPAQAPVNATRMHLAGDVDTAYKRVGLALQQGDLGTVTAQDPASHSYQLSVASKAALGDSQGGFLKKHFSNLQEKSQQEAGSGTQGGENGKEVTLTVTAGANGGSEVEAHGDQEQAARIISALNSRLGG